ncbi:MAG: hypothetical protein IKI29_04810 [Clostridia bacterium]|nr:hypothetical protein [Clostridia bacterium]
MRIKRVCYLAIILLFSVLSFSVNAQEELPSYRLQLGENYTVVSAENTKEAAALLGIPEQQFRDYRAQNHVLTVAAAKDGGVRLSLTAEQNAFSRSAKSFAGYEKNDLEKLLPHFLADGISGSIIYGQNKVPYFRLHSTAADDAGNFTVTRYLTVCRNTQFTLWIEAGEETADDLPDRLFRTLSVGETPEKPSAWLSVIIIGGIVAFSAIALWCSIRIMQDLLHPKKKESN